jgi:hypothetical protein
MKISCRSESSNISLIVLDFRSGSAVNLAPWSGSAFEIRIQFCIHFRVVKCFTKISDLVFFFIIDKGQSSHPVSCSWNEKLFDFWIVKYSFVCFGRAGIWIRIRFQADPYWEFRLDLYPHQMRWKSSLNSVFSFFICLVDIFTRKYLTELEKNVTVWQRNPRF